jgi:hypothetical protein
MSNSNDGEPECWKIDFSTFEYVAGIPCENKIKNIYTTVIISF